MKSQTFKQTEIGLIPEDWEVEAIKKLALITTGAKNTQDRIDNGKYPFFVRSQTIERINSYSFDGEAVLTAGDGVGTGKVFHYINGKFDLHQRVYKISNFDSRLDGYFFYLYFSNRFFDRMMSITAKSSVDSVRMEMIADMLVPLPDKSEQIAIANSIRDIQILIEFLDKLIVKKKNIKQGTMQELLTGKRRLSGFKGEWDVKLIKDLIIKQNKTSRQSGDGLIEGKYPFFTNSTKPYNAYLNEYDFDDEMIIANTGGTAYFDYYNGKFAAMSDCFVFRTKEFSKFLYYKLKMIVVYINDVGFTGSGIKHLDKNLFGNIELKLPKDPQEQSAIAQILSDMDSEIERLEKQRNKYKEIKTGMMQELLTGRIRLK